MSYNNEFMNIRGRNNYISVQQRIKNIESKSNIKNTKEKKIDTTRKLYLINKDRKLISWIHDIPPFPGNLEEFKNNKIVNMVIEIPKGTNKKMEMSVSELYNPIIQDEKKGKLRLVPNPTHENTEELFYNESILEEDKKFEIKTYKDIYGEPYTGYNLFSYGAIPGTFEDKKNVNQIEFIDGQGIPTLNKYKEGEGLFPLRGDGDPLDICLLSDYQKRKVGDIVKVKVIGVFPMIDDGEIDWKIIAIPENSKEPDEKMIYKAKLWFKYYKDKSTTKKGIVNIGDGVLLKNSDLVDKVIEHCINDYKNIMNSCPDTNEYNKFVKIDTIKNLDLDNEPIVANFNLFNTKTYRDAFPNSIECKIFADHSYHKFNIIVGKKELSVITANGGSIFHPIKGINSNLKSLTNKIYDLNENLDLLRCILDLVKNSLEIRETDMNADIINLRKKNLEMYKDSIKNIIDIINQRFNNKSERNPISMREDDIKNIAKNLTQNAGSTPEFKFKEGEQFNSSLNNFIKLINKFRTEGEFIESKPEYESKIKDIDDIELKRKIKEILEKNLNADEKQYAVYRDLAGLFKAQTTGGFKIEKENPYNNKNDYLSFVRDLAYNCDILILTEGIPNLNEFEEFENSKIFQEELQIKYNPHLNKENNIEETTNIIFKNTDLNVDFFKDTPIPGEKMNNSSLVKIDDTFILNIHGPSSGELTPRKLFHNTVKKLEDQLGTNINYICGDANMDHYYQDKLRPNIKKDFERYFGPYIKLQVSDFKIRKQRWFGMPYINNQFWKGADPEAYDVQFALSIGEPPKLNLQDTYSESNINLGDTFLFRGNGGYRRTKRKYKKVRKKIHSRRRNKKIKKIKKSFLHKNKIKNRKNRKITKRR